MTTSTSLSQQAAQLRSARITRSRHHKRVTALLAAALVLIFGMSLMIGETFYPPMDVLRAIFGQQVPGASYTVNELRLPRSSLAVIAGLAFGMSGIIFQTLLRNQLASPDIIGISSGAGAAGIVGIVIFQLPQSTVSVLALVAGLIVAAGIYLLSLRGGFSGTRLILIGIGMAAMLHSVVTYTLSQAAAWDLSTATRWLSGSLNGATWERTIPVLITVIIALPIQLLLSNRLAVLRLGDAQAIGLGLRVNVVRVVVVVGAVALIAVATAACGPIAFVALMSGPIAARLVGPGAPLVVPAGLIGALLVISSDLIGQYLLGTRYPVGVITGILGAPYLIYLLVRSDSKGSAL
ncbi:FecCD family ABC transporter permease [Corynebacterium alimapuense]|uniref:ABC transporter permease n=1 Tax=Corynebacterium alimapuense TaxID=1576874 RepID=A0A3M8K6L9_9CORY|nr:iron ABC transporter permease [Corynebacterium alimapuense]RNE48806.1 ABC transporter permease [Corynebacterium alimapuense]